MRRPPLVLLAVPALALARLLSAHGIGLGLRLAAASACLLIPGALIARILRLRGLAPVLAWTLASLLLSLAVTFWLHRSLWLTLALLGGISLAALPAALRRRARMLGRGELLVLAAGIAFGIALWWVATLDGDAFFHLARVRKLELFGSLSLRNVGEFKDGG
ncbi:MAG TPA: hypothetical protein VF002_04270, partial [Gaiellaceae bacterium]